MFPNGPLKTSARKNKGIFASGSLNSPTRENIRPPHFLFYPLPISVSPTSHFISWLHSSPLSPGHIPLLFSPCATEPISVNRVTEGVGRAYALCMLSVHGEPSSVGLRSGQRPSPADPGRPLQIRRRLPPASPSAVVCVALPPSPSISLPPSFPPAWWEECAGADGADLSPPSPLASLLDPMEWMGIDSGVAEEAGVAAMGRQSVDRRPLRASRALYTRRRRHPPWEGRKEGSGGEGARGNRERERELRE